MMRERSGTSGSAAGGSGGPGMESLPPRQPDYMSVCLFAEEPYQKLAMETLEELDGENRHYFEENGGEKYAFIPCLNDSDLGMRVIEHVVRRELQGWI